MELFIVLLAVAAHFVIGYLVFNANRKHATNRAFLFFAIVAAIWGVIQYLSLYQPTEETTLDLIRWAMAAAILYSYALYLLIHTFPAPHITMKRGWLIFWTLISAVLFVLARTPLIFSSIKGSGPTAEPIPGVGIPLFGLTTGFFIIGSIVLLIMRYRKAHGSLRSQLQYLLIGVIGSALLMFVTNFLIVVMFNITSLIAFGPAYTLVFLVATGYAIVAHHLFDIRVIIKRTVVYSGLLLFAVAAYSMIIFFFTTLFGGEAVFDTHTFISNLIAAGIIAAGFEPLRKWLVGVTDKYLFVGEYKAEEVIAELAQTLSSVLDLAEALQTMMTTLTKALRIRNTATFIVRNDEKEGLMVRRTESVGYMPGAQLTLPRPSTLLKHFSDPKSEVLVVEEYKDMDSIEPVIQASIAEMESLSGAVALPIRATNKLIGVLIIGPKLSGDIFSQNDIQFLDITAKQTAAAIEKSRFYEDDQLKSEFVSIASHELLTPTAAIEGYLSMILDEGMGQVDPKAEKYLRNVQSSARRLAELVADLLSVSRIESGKIVINKQPVEVSGLVQKVIDEIKIKADKAEIGLQYLAPTQPLPKVLADPDRLTQVLVNLISNAIKYNKKNGRIEVSTKNDGKFVTFVVADNGIGISPENLPHLFEKFYRVADDSAAAEKVGTGLGLYITKSIVELQGGKMNVASKLGQGSVFSFTIPLA
jgi:signal transduction histidine kinase